MQGCSRKRRCATDLIIEQTGIQLDKEATTHNITDHLTNPLSGERKSISGEIWLALQCVTQTVAIESIVVYQCFFVFFPNFFKIIFLVHCATSR